MTQHNDEHDRPTPAAPAPDFDDQTDRSVDEATDRAQDAVSDAVTQAAGEAADGADDVSEGVETAGDLLESSEVASTLAGGATRLGGSAIREALDRAELPEAVEQGASAVVGLAGGALEAAVSSGGGRGDDDGGVSDGLEAVAEALAGGGGGAERVSLSFECDEVDIAWEVGSASLTEGLNQPYSLGLQLVTEDRDAEPARLLGASCRLVIGRGDLVRQVTGLVSQVQEENGDGARVAAEVVVLPALGLLRQRCHTRIFQDMSVPEILQAVLEEGLAATQRTVELRLGRDYPTCEYRTQYDETDLGFCQRLMEEEGIVAWFETGDENETLVLADSAEQYRAVESIHGEALEFSEFGDSTGGREQVTGFRVLSQLRPTRLTTRHHDWTHPSAPIEGDSGDSETEPDESDPPDGARIGPEREHFEHDLEPISLFGWSDAWTGNDSDVQVRLRREQQAFGARMIQGRSTAVGVGPGKIFELTGHPRPELNGRYLVLTASHAFTGDSASNSFTCIPADVPYRPPRLTPKPRIASVQTATVTGPAGEEIHTDCHGRIKVRFHWDRLSESDDTSSCFVRVMQPWAGAGWGFVFLPRVGMEVVVSFVGGDPDQPLVVGSVYNGEHAPPYPLPDEKTKSTIKSQSTTDAEGFNELTFEDAAGEEQIILHAQKDLNETVENDHATTVHGSQTNSVDGSQAMSSGGDQSFSVGENRSISVEGTQETTVRGGENKTVVTGNHLVEASDKVEVKAPTHIKLEVGDSTVLIEPGKITLTAGDGSSITLDANAIIQSSQGSSAQLTDEVLVKSSLGSKTRWNADIEASSNAGSVTRLDSDAVMSSSGGSAVELTSDAVMSSNGGSSVTLDANAVVAGSAEAEVRAPKSTVSGAGGAVEAGGSGVKATGGQVDLSGGVVNVSGGVVSIN